MPKSQCVVIFARNWGARIERFRGRNTDCLFDVMTTAEPVGEDPTTHLSWHSSIGSVRNETGVKGKLL